MNNKCSRRNFLKLSGTATAGLAATVYCPDKFLLWAEEQGLAKAEYIPTYCEMCFWKCGGFAKVINGRVVKLEGNPLHPHSRGRLCGRGNGGIGLLYDSDRLKKPLIRTGKRGDGQYREASWEEALSLITEKMNGIKAQYGAESMALFSHGSPTSHFYPLLSAFGSPNVAMPSFAQCRGPRVAAYELTYGGDIGSPERLDMANSRVMVFFGSHLGENMHSSQVQDFTEAIASGSQAIVVDPRFSTAAGKADHWLPIKPGTDMALILAWINIIIENKWFDRAFVAEYCEGFEDLAEEVAEYTAEWASKETDLPAALIHETARQMAKNAPAVCIHPGRHVTWDGNDVQRERAIAILQAILGTWGRKGGVYMATKAKLPAVPGPKPFPKPQRQALNRGDFPHAGMEGVTNVVREATTTGSPYPIKGWIVSGTNLMAAMPNQQETIEAINNLDLLVVVDVMPTATAMMADVILPECTYLERQDAITVLKGRELAIATRQPAVEPMYDSKPGWWIARELGLRLGLKDYYPWEDYDEKLEEDCLVWDIDYDELKKKGVIVVPDTANPYIGAGNEPSFHTSSKKIQLYSEELELDDFDPVPRFRPPIEPGKDEFRLLYGRSPVHTFSRTVNNPALSELYAENEVWVNAKKAKSLGLKNGDYVRLVNQDGVGSNRIRVKATERIRQDCVYMVHGFGHTGKRMRRAYQKGADDQQLITRYIVDPIAGTTGMRVNFVKLVKEA